MSSPVGFPEDHGNHNFFAPENNGPGDHDEEDVDGLDVDNILGNAFEMPGDVGLDIQQFDEQHGFGGGGFDAYNSSLELDEPLTTTPILTTEDGQLL